MAVLVLNTGSSSLKFGIFSAGGEIELRGTVPLQRTEAGEAAAQLIRRLRQQPETAALTERISAVGHRIVHGGEEFSLPVLLDASALAILERISALAPLHNPPAIEAVRSARDALGPSVPHVGVFDTGFFALLPDHARTYALPKDWNARPGARRYGFHGIAHRSMYERCPRRRLITLQLGQGCSAAALRNGSPIDTSMGATPLEGLVMATRCGDVDAGLILRIMEEEALTPAAASEALNRRAGLLGLSGTTGGMRELLAAESTDPGAALAVRVFCLRVRKYLGAYLALLGGADAVVFGGGIGENSPDVRARICENMEWCGLSLDAQANANALGVSSTISSADSRVEVQVVAVDEESLLARETLAAVEGKRREG